MIFPPKVAVGFSLITTLCQVQENALEQDGELFIVFDDFSRALGTVDSVTFL